jgi:hypothetical protein
MGIGYKLYGARYQEIVGHTPLQLGLIQIFLEVFGFELGLP